MGFATLCYAQNSPDFESGIDPKVVGSFTDVPQALLVRDANDQISIALSREAKKNLGIISTTGKSDFHLIFKPGVGYALYGVGPVKGINTSEAFVKVPFEKGIFFHGVSFAHFSQIHLDLSSPGSVVSFDRATTSGKVGFKVLEFELGPLIAPFERRFFRVIVTEFGEVLPLSAGATSMRSLLREDLLVAGRGAFNAEEYLKKKLFRISNYKRSGGFTFEQLGPHAATVNVTLEKLRLVKSVDFDSVEPWRSAEKLYGHKIQEWSCYANYYSKNSQVPSLFEMQLKLADHDAWEHLAALQVEKRIAGSRALKRVQSLGRYQPQSEISTFGIHLSVELQSVQNKTLLEPEQIFSPVVRFPLNEKNRDEFNYFFWLYSQGFHGAKTGGQLLGRNAYLIDLDQTKMDAKLFDEVMTLRESGQSFFLITVKEGIAEASYVAARSSQSIGYLLRRTETLGCDRVLSSATLMAVSPGAANEN